MLFTKRSEVVKLWCSCAALAFEPFPFALFLANFCRFWAPSLGSRACLTVRFTIPEVRIELGLRVVLGPFILLNQIRNVYDLGIVSVRNGVRFPRMVIRTLL